MTIFLRLKKKAVKFMLVQQPLPQSPHLTLPLPRKLRYGMERESLESSERGVDVNILLPSFLQKWRVGGGGWTWWGEGYWFQETYSKRSGMPVRKGNQCLIPRWILEQMQYIQTCPWPEQQVVKKSMEAPNTYLRNLKEASKGRDTVVCFLLRNFSKAGGLPHQSEPELE